MYFTFLCSVSVGVRKRPFRGHKVGDGNDAGRSASSRANFDRRTFLPGCARPIQENTAPSGTSSCRQSRDFPLLHDTASPAREFETPENFSDILLLRLFSRNRCYRPSCDHIVPKPSMNNSSCDECKANGSIWCRESVTFRQLSAPSQFCDAVFKCCWPSICRATMRWGIGKNL